MFQLVQDSDSHWYVIPADKNDEWEEFVTIPEDDERSWDVPAYAVAVGGSPSLVKFDSYEIK